MKTATELKPAPRIGLALGGGGRVQLGQLLLLFIPPLLLARARILRVLTTKMRLRPDDTPDGCNVTQPPAADGDGRSESCRQRSHAGAPART